MALWSNTDANTSAPKGMATGFAATGTFANGFTLWANAQSNIVTTDQAVGVFGVDSTEQSVSSSKVVHPQHAGWVLRKVGMGPVESITANTGAVASNGYITFTAGNGNGATTGNTAANARIYVNTAGYVVNVTVVTPGLYANTPVVTGTTGNAVYTVVMGGRANRVQTETLVAMGSMYGDGTTADDPNFPDA